MHAPYAFTIDQTRLNRALVINNFHVLTFEIFHVDLTTNSFSVENPAIFSSHNKSYKFEVRVLAFALAL